MKRVLSFILVFAMLISAVFVLAACRKDVPDDTPDSTTAGTVAETTESPYDENGLIKDSLDMISLELDLLKEIEIEIKRR